jgi:hypothetical protein
MDGIPLINGREYAWGDVVLTIGGMPVSGITAIEYKDEQEMVDNYGAGRYPVSRTKGRITTTAKITLDMKEVRSIQKGSLTGRLQDIEPFLITITYVPDDAASIHTDMLHNCQFKSNGRSWKEGDTKQNVEIDLLCSHITWGK